MYGFVLHIWFTGLEICMPDLVRDRKAIDGTEKILNQELLSLVRMISGCSLARLRASC